MTVLSAHQLSVQVNQGDWVFQAISFTLTHRITGLVGRNGSGKSVLLSVLAGDQQPTSGGIDCSLKRAYFKQNQLTLSDTTISIAQFMGIDKKLHALKKITAGHCDAEYFNTLQDDWLVEQKANQLLQSLGINMSLTDAFSKLSGGQMTKLRLHQIFHSGAELILLDEPSNHLDKNGRAWLIDRILKFKGYVFIVSHDRSLLRIVDVIFRLSRSGLSRFEGYYDDFLVQSQLHELALKRRIDHHKKDQNRLARQQQLTNERAQKRAQQAVAQRKTASQPKILLDAKKDSASHSLSSLKTQQSRQKTENQRALEELKKNYEAVKPQSIYLHDVQAQKQSLQKQPLVLKASKVLKVSKVSFDWLKNKPVSFDIFRQQHLRLYGANGSGKSTLLKAIHGESRCFSGHIIRNCETVYLDQHFNLLASVSNSNMLACLSDSCPGLSEQQARTLLAGIGFRRQAVYQQVCDLSGGEKMKLAMLMVSHMAETPLLLLDEPDNHLDIESKQLLAQALSQYRGAFLLVSHDEDFVVETRVAEQLIL